MSALTFDTRRTVVLPTLSLAALASRAAGILRDLRQRHRLAVTLHQLSPVLLRDIGMERPGGEQASRALTLELVR